MRLPVHDSSPFPEDHSCVRTWELEIATLFYPHGIDLGWRSDKLVRAGLKCRLWPEGSQAVMAQHVGNKISGLSIALGLIGPGTVGKAVLEQLRNQVT